MQTKHERPTEKNHRLPREHYKGGISAAFTICLHDKASAFMRPDMVTVFTEMLGRAAIAERCIIPVYCFMPDHQHLIVSGTALDSDAWKVIVTYKQRTGYWLSRNAPHVRWQKDFYDHIIRKDGDLGVQVRYILDNPVRKGIVSSWRDYPYKGAIGCSLDDVLNGIM
jgi:REP element-mobilizing transposase RayT